MFNSNEDQMSKTSVRVIMVDSVGGSRSRAYSNTSSRGIVNIGGAISTIHRG